MQSSGRYHKNNKSIKNGRLRKPNLPPIPMVVFTLISVRAWSILLFSCILLQTIEAIHWVSKIQQLIIGCSLFVLGIEEIDIHHGCKVKLHNIPYYTHEVK